MKRQIFINLAVADVSRTVAFWKMQGFDDPDGHHWELVHMSEAVAGKG